MGATNCEIVIILGAFVPVLIPLCLLAVLGSFSSHLYAKKYFQAQFADFGSRDERFIFQFLVVSCVLKVIFCMVVFWDTELQAFGFPAWRCMGLGVFVLLIFFCGCSS